MESPGGRAPASIMLDGVPLLAQIPPAVKNCRLYAAPIVAAGRESVRICRGADWAWSNEAPVRRPATARVPRVYLAVITYCRSSGHGLARLGTGGMIHCGHAPLFENHRTRRRRRPGRRC